ncbi:HAD-IIA family hydrolase [uncultured Robinsoniella sp.]|uniref:HAD-IIA family hydrolase n=1 Tax=uncultured Robinsoniella sp. TaxID=904190 RepID=UPI00374E9BA0
MSELSKKKLFLFDIDGSLSVGDTLFDGSRELLEYIEKIGGRAYYITNNSTKSNGDYVEKFARWNLTTEEEQFVTSGYMAIRYLKENFRDQKIFVLGTKSYLAELRKQGIVVTEEVEEDVTCVLAAYDSELNYQKLEKACELLYRKEVAYLATNPDLCCPAPFGFIPDCGAICNMLEAAVYRKPRYLGKPSREVVELCLKRSGFSRKETLVVGDRLYTDIACGIEGKAQTCLLLTGEAKREDLQDTIYPPDYCFGTVRELLEYIES